MMRVKIKGLAEVRVGEMDEADECQRVVLGSGGG